MAWRKLDRLDRPVLDDLAAIHHDDTVDDLGDELEVVRDEDDGEVLLDGQSMAELMRDHAGPWRRRVQMVFQDSSSALNPRKSVERCLGETLALRGVPRAQRDSEIADLLTLVGLGPEIGPRLPHELSGGQRQRIGLARALAMKPEVLIADEPVSALDVSLQAQVINLLSRLTRELGLTLLFISHDLALVRTLCSRIVVMRKGAIVEQGPCLDVLGRPQHPYTQALIAAVPKCLAGRRTPLPARADAATPETREDIHGAA
jgi:ABC-type glutathione transport system ATPase component